MATTDDQLVTARGLAQSLSGAVGSVVLYDDRSGADSVTLSESVTGFSAIQVTCVRYYGYGQKEAYAADFTMVYPKPDDKYYVSIPTPSDSVTSALFQISSNGKTIKNPYIAIDYVKIFRVVGYRSEPTWQTPRTSS